MKNIVSLAFAIGGIILAYLGKEGWGWCFFLSLMTHVWYTNTEDENQSK